MEKGIYGINCDPHLSKFQILPMPFDATASYRRGAARGPLAIFLASKQVELLDIDIGSPIKAGIYFHEEPPNISQLNKRSSCLVDKIRKLSNKNHITKYINELQKYTQKNNEFTHKWSNSILKKQQVPIILGGDHSTPLGSIIACSERYSNMGILQIDAHADLRNTYEGFIDSHASIMYNILTKTKINNIVQVGIRDYCEEEALCIEKNHIKVKTFFDSDLRRARLSGNVINFFKQVLALLPNTIYLTVDIDGLDPSLCPNTGTPVPGGFRFDEFVTLLEILTSMDKKIIGMDLVEVAIPHNLPQHQWGEAMDANIGARVLYKMIGFALKTKP